MKGEKGAATIAARESDDDSAGKSLTLTGAISLIVGCIVGVGVFTNGGLVLGYVDSAGMAMVIWIFGALVAFAGGLSYTEWGLMITESGGDLPYLEFIYRKPKQFASFLYCFCRVILIHTGFTSALCQGAGEYAMLAFGLDGDATFKLWTSKLIGIVLLSTIFLFTAFSNNIATRVGTVITFAKILIVLFVIVSGIAAALGAVNIDKPKNFEKPFEGTATDPSNYASALYLIFFCYDGWAMLSTSVGELKNPVQNIPRAMIMGISIVGILYVGTNLSYFLVLSNDEIIASKQFLAAKFAEKVYGKAFGRVMSALIMVSAYGSAMAMTFGASRVAQASAQRGFLPMSGALSRLHSRFQTPFNAIVFHCVITLVLTLITASNDAFKMLMLMTCYPTWVFYGTTVAGLIIARFTHPLKERKFKVWIICPVLIVCVAIFLSIFPFLKGGIDAICAAIGLGTIGLASILYYFIIYRNMRTTV